MSTGQSENGHRNESLPKLSEQDTKTLRNEIYQLINSFSTDSKNLSIVHTAFQLTTYIQEFLQPAEFYFLIKEILESPAAESFNIYDLKYETVLITIRIVLNDSTNTKISEMTNIPDAWMDLFNKSHSYWQQIESDISLGDDGKLESLKTFILQIVQNDTEDDY